MKDHRKVNVKRKILKVFLGKGQSVACLCQGLILRGGKTEGPQVWRLAEMNENGRIEALSLTTEGKKKMNKVKTEQEIQTEDYVELSNLTFET